jgi:hypothetical protein
VVVAGGVLDRECCKLLAVQERVYREVPMDGFDDGDDGDRVARIDG